MHILLDTRVLIWWHEKNPRLNKKMRDIIADDANEVFVSIVTLWEIAIKLSSKKIKLTVSRKMEALQDNFILLDLDILDVQRVMELPWIHRDPFDRMLIAQAKRENLYLMTDDAAILRYDLRKIEP